MTSACFTFTDLKRHHELVSDDAVGAEERRAGEAVSHGRGGGLAARARRT